MPWFESLGMRQVKAPKIFLRDTGHLHNLLGLEAATDLAGHPKVGASWEGFALEQTLRLDHLWLICPGNDRVRLEPKLEICGIQRLPEIL